MRNRDRGKKGLLKYSEADRLRLCWVRLMRRFDKPVQFEQALLSMVEAFEERYGGECGTAGIMAFGQAFGDLIRRGKLARIDDADGVARYYLRRRRGARSFFAGSARL